MLNFSQGSGKQPSYDGHSSAGLVPFGFPPGRFPAIPPQARRRSFEVAGEALSAASAASAPRGSTRIAAWLEHTAVLTGVGPLLAWFWKKKHKETNLLDGGPSF